MCALLTCPDLARFFSGDLMPFAVVLSSLAAFEGARGLAAPWAAAGLAKNLPMVDCFIAWRQMGLWRHAERAGAVLTHKWLRAHRGSTSLLQMLKVAMSSDEAKGRRCECLKPQHSLRELYNTPEAILGSIRMPGAMYQENQRACELRRDYIECRMPLSTSVATVKGLSRLFRASSLVLCRCDKAEDVSCFEPQHAANLAPAGLPRHVCLACQRLSQ